MRILVRSLIAGLFLAPLVFAGDTIPKVAWKRPIGQPLENPGGRKPELAPSGMIDDGYWQGAPVGGFGAGTFSRTYRGDFARWHLKAGAHKYQTVFANQFAMYQKSEGAGEGVAQVLASVHPSGIGLSSWKWDYPAGAGDYYALYPKSWYEYSFKQFPAHVVLEQFSPVLPHNYRETSYPVAVYRWHAENRTDRAVTVSIMLSWSNMLGWFRDFNHDFSGALNAGNRNRFVDQDGVKAIVFDRNHTGPVQDEFDGQFAIATLDSPGLEVTHFTTFLVNETPGAEV